MKWGQIKKPSGLVSGEAWVRPILLNLLFYIDNKNNIVIDTFGIDNSKYLKTINLYLDAFIRITQNPDLKSKCNSIAKTDTPEPVMIDLISESEQITKTVNIKDGTIRFENEVEYD